MNKGDLAIVKYLNCSCHSNEQRRICGIDTNFKCNEIVIAVAQKYEDDLEYNDDVWNFISPYGSKIFTQLINVVLIDKKSNDDQSR